MSRRFQLNTASVLVALWMLACGGVEPSKSTSTVADATSAESPAAAQSAPAAGAAAGSRAASMTPAQAGQSGTTMRPVTAAPSAPAAPSSSPGAMPAAGGTAGTSTAAAGGAVAPSVDAGTAPSGEGSASCLDMITDYTAMGPFSFELKIDGSIYMWVPMVPAGCKVPVTHLANGTGAGCMNYEEINSYLASHGFLASCYDNGNTGAGDQGIMALEKVYELYPDLADKKIGSTGHSQGGQASFIVLQYAEAKFGADYKYAGLAMEPASGFGAQPSQGSWSSIYGMIKSPMFMFHGTADALVASTWVGQAYNAMGETEAYWWAAIGATHVPTPDAHTQQVAIPWFRWKLLGDKKACEAFKALPDTDQWDAVESKNEAGCE